MQIAIIPLLHYFLFYDQSWEKQQELQKANIYIYWSCPLTSSNIIPDHYENELIPETKLKVLFKLWNSQER